MLSRPKKKETKPDPYFPGAVCPAHRDNIIYNQCHDDHTPYIEWIEEEHDQVFQKQLAMIQEMNTELRSLEASHRKELERQRRTPLDELWAEEKRTLKASHRKELETKKEEIEALKKAWIRLRKDHRNELVKARIETHRKYLKTDIQTGNNEFHSNHDVTISSAKYNIAKLKNSLEKGTP